MAKKSKKPSGLGITRSGKKFICSWTRGETYQEQEINHGKHKYLVAPGKYKEYEIEYSLNGSASKDTFEHNPSDYYPHTGDTRTSIKFKVRGKAKDKTYSEWVSKSKTIHPPKTPSLSLEKTSPEVAKFSWSVGSAGKDSFYVFERVRWQTELTTGTASPKWNGTLHNDSAASKSVTQTENTQVIATGSHTRWFRVMAQGMGGYTSWVTKKRTYATPRAAKITAQSGKGTNVGVNCSLTWTTDTSGGYPIDSIVPQYLVIEPAANMSLPAGQHTWTECGGYIKTSGKDKVEWTINGTIEDDKVVFAQVVTKHEDRENYSTPVILYKGKLSAPDELSIDDIDTTQHTATISAKNNSDVPDSFLVVSYKDSVNKNPVDIAIIPHGDDSVNLTYPNTASTNRSFGVRAVVGSATYKTVSGYRQYTITPKMQSAGIIWTGGTLPLAPANVSVEPTEVSGSVRVNWDWTWSEADSAVISWADHADAWESTDEPEEYTVSNIHASSWNIAGLEVGKTWYVRVRLVNTVGGQESYGPWSEIREIDLSSAPAIPWLRLSKETITEDEIVTAYWSYVTTDGQAQSYAVLGEIVNNEVVEIDHAGTAQHIDLDPQKYGWTAGTSHELCVKVKSAAGRESGDWSLPVQLNVAEPLECEITATSLVYDSVEVNPRNFAGNPIDFETTLEEDVTKMSVSLEPIQDTSGGQPSPTHVCPISGHTEVSVTVADDDTNPTVSETYSLDLDRTVYGGSVDLVSGVLKSYPSYNPYNGETLVGEWISDRDVYAVGTTPTIGAQVVNIGATPITYQLTPQEVQTLVGENHLTTEDDNISVRIAEGTETGYYLKAMPLTLTVTGAGNGGKTSVVIERADDYRIDRPDESEFHGFDNETILIATQTGEDEITIEQLDDRFIGTLDDNAPYNIIATVQDDLGQTSKAELPFKVAWTHQAIVPDADVEVLYNGAIKITPQLPSEVPTGWEFQQGDVCDIYRLSADKPELIYEGADFGTPYVDPYPAIGESGGHRLVYRTVNGDYTTGDIIAWLDLRAEQGDIFETEDTLIDFAGEQIALKYGVDFSNTWEKDFRKQRYLGGSIKGDWNAGVERSSSVSASTLNIIEQDKIEALRRLANHEGICHLRTPDGSSYACDIQESDDHPSHKYGKVTGISFDVNRVETQEPDGMTYERWQELYGLE